MFGKFQFWYPKNGLRPSKKNYFKTTSDAKANAGVLEGF
jgi:hypothetical protein